MGLGQAERILELEVEWPTSGTRQLFQDVPLDSFLRVTEKADGFEVLESKALRLGG